MKIYEKAFYTEKGYYASRYAKTKEEILNIHQECKTSPVIYEIIISGVECPDNAVDHYCQHLIASYQNMATPPWLYYRPTKLELYFVTDNGTWVRDDYDEVYNLATKYKINK